MSLISPSHDRACGYKFWIDDDDPDKRTTVVQGKKAEKETHTAPSFDHLFDMVLDGQRQLGLKLDHLSALQPLVEQVSDELKQLSFNLSVLRKRPDDSVMPLDRPSDAMLGPRSSFSGESLLPFRKDSVAMSENETSLYGVLPKTQTGLSLPVTKRASDVCISDKVMVHVRVDGVEFEQHGDDDSQLCSCTVKLGERNVLQTDRLSGQHPQWKHEEAVPYQEDLLEFCVVVEENCSTHNRTGKASVNLSEARASGGFSGLLQLTQPVEQSADDYRSPILGQLAVTVWFDIAPQIEASLAPSVTRHTTGLTVPASVKHKTSTVQRLRHSMLAVASSNVMAQGLQGFRPQKTLPWPTSVPIREGLDDEQQDVGTRVSNGHQALVAMEAEWGRESHPLTSSKRNVTDSSGSKCTLTGLPKFCAGCILNPASKQVLAYDLLSSIVLLHDFVVIPYMLAWDIPLEGWFNTASIISCLFWTGDIFISFVTGCCSLSFHVS